MALPALLFSTGPLFSYGLEEALEILADAGFLGAELMVSRDPATWDPDRVSRASRATGVGVRAVHGPFLLLTRGVFGKDPRTKVERTVDLARSIGAEVVVLHPVFRWQRDYLPLLEELREGGPTITVENMFPLALGGRALWVHRWCSLADLAQLAPLTLDTSHLAVARVEPEEALEELEGKVAHVHLSNNLGNGRDSHSPLDRGVLDLGRFVKRLLRSGYSGYITLEVDCSSYLGSRRELVRFLSSMREAAEAMVGAASEPEGPEGRDPS